LLLFFVRFFISTGATLLTWMAMTALGFVAYSGLYAPSDVQVVLSAMNARVLPDPIPQSLLLAGIAAAAPVFAYQQFLLLAYSTISERAPEQWVDPTT
jgi:hypothetical protein